MRMRTDAIIFDMDGTMINSMPWHAQAWVEFVRRRRMDVCRRAQRLAQGKAFAAHAQHVGWR